MLSVPHTLMISRNGSITSLRDKMDTYTPLRKVQKQAIGSLISSLGHRKSKDLLPISCIKHVPLTFIFLHPSLLQEAERSLTGKEHNSFGLNLTGTLLIPSPKESPHQIFACEVVSRDMN